MRLLVAVLGVVALIRASVARTTDRDRPDRPTRRTGPPPPATVPVPEPRTAPIGLASPAPDGEPAAGVPGLPVTGNPPGTPSAFPAFPAIAHRLGQGAPDAGPAVATVEATGGRPGLDGPAPNTPLWQVAGTALSPVDTTWPAPGGASALAVSGAHDGVRSVAGRLGSLGTASDTDDEVDMFAEVLRDTLANMREATDGMSAEDQAMVAEWSAIGAALDDPVEARAAERSVAGAAVAGPVEDRVGERSAVGAVVDGSAGARAAMPVHAVSELTASAGGDSGAGTTAGGTGAGQSGGWDAAVAGRPAGPAEVGSGARTTRGGGLVRPARGPADTAVLEAVVCDDPEMDGAGPTPGWVRLLRIGFAVLGVVALAWSGTHLSGQPQADHYSYFTIQSNIVAAVVLLAGGLFDPRGRIWQRVRGAVTLYLLITGIVYAVLLAHLETADHYPWVNDVLHRAMPIVLLLDWVVVPVALRLTVRLVAAWLLYPVAYGAYSLLRGLVVDWYPYPFLNPVHQGYLSMSLGLIVLVGVFSLLAVAVVALGDLAARLHGPAPR
ncbi:Pr6Pr family membrane protein [Nocardia sp. alder85J]|uniref:Pr6Pr family membrane protein n=1 Tax=Nocardia sp. alder85J TaxID=2862949 RepID=UPI001CD39B71|nr:Pr6Pr family membrane protein [Nocardia sp. alder85J]MCX4094902.1 Pr6Pr family membrane protein [Nocardia sp. alder85J]